MYLANRLLDVDDVDDDNIAFVVDDVDGDDDGGYGNYGRINFMLFSLRVTFFCVTAILLTLCLFPDTTNQSKSKEINFNKTAREF